MRKTLLASAAILGATGGLAFAQNAPNPTQGQYVAPLLGGPAANNNLNTFGTAVPGAAVAPTPGSVVIRLNGKVYADFDVSYGTGLQTAAKTIVPAAGGTPNAAGYKLNPIGAASYFRLYPGIDGMATNGLRYGAGVEIRENFEGGNSFAVSSATTITAATPSAGATASTITTLPSGTATSGTNASASGVSSAETLFVRRAFVYLGADQLGIIRVGQADGLPGIYDATGIFTVGSWDGGIGNLNDSGVESVTPNQYLNTWPFMSGNGTEYANNKIVYLSPSFFGIDIGLEFSPSEGNILTNSVTSDPYAVGPCNTASANCESVTSGTDSSRWINRFGFGGRFIESFAGAVVQGYGEWIISGKADNGAAVQASPANLAANPAVAGLAGGGTAPGALKYDAENFFNGGLAVTYLGVTANADVTLGRENGSNAMVTTGGAPEHAVLVGLSYAVGQFAFGAVTAIEDSQGAAAMTGTSQKHEFSFAVGGVYKIAPGINLCLEYQYEQKHQGDVNLNTGANGVTTGNNIHAQGLTLATIVNW
jgi:hypothetical protein